MIAPDSTAASASAPTVRKAVVPAAGLGTRFLPATKATPKEMLPVVDKPAIQYVVEEAAAAGLDDILMVTGRHKRAIEDHFDHAFELEQALATKGDTVRLDAVRDPARLADIHHIRQGDPLGLGHAVLCARHHVGNQPFAVLLGDDLIDPRETLLSRMLEVRERYRGSVVALMEVDPAQIHLYGCAAVHPTGEEGVVRVTGLVEKPAAGTAPSRYAVIGRYVLDPAVFEVLAHTPPGRSGEIQLTDALQGLAAAGTVHGVVFTGLRYDTGDKADYLRTVVRLACARPDLGPEFTGWLKEFVSGLEDGGTAVGQGHRAA
ncbi:UTP--glucose-1-phosphate uridylyltransferase [Streptomyces pluripotens]|uniref:UTP--glucose-1-phosphate uridylyltransferase n=1 Tax=Streptomyces pluripotens TaxID=1355015 RepID=A0A221NTU8_9ACTN|nr:MULTISPECIES: UTP--glucose-1-phosphate uridylyltransferase GalU [Streptomyces]ARP69094.1 UTP--glucose-1-phosphate uridylyltransferase [Streptomyces pluripotens]ASN23354.1 UTP--glucose-1-phosphate uridylyltransferase [Streptomyces pluripotens]KIE25628.1 UTP--glucose-1-phosphate uridylyltransferase [Streptomyces sp. MUSC 125]MCH0559008.1 UTP--glucose-1-phosphate uridylyltransferase GalU [Streptomyces sp. MUM 16J]